MDESPLEEEPHWRWVLQHPFTVLDRALPTLEDNPARDHPGPFRARYRALAARGRRALRYRLGFLIVFYTSGLSSIILALARMVLPPGPLVDLLGRVLTFAAVFLALPALLAAYLLNRYVSSIQNRLVVLGMLLSSRGGS